MAQRFVSLEEAAHQLGISTEQLHELRESGRARAFRDGTSWKFKTEEIDRLKTSELTTEIQENDILEEDFDDLSLEESSSILLDEASLGGTGDESPSTIIGDSERNDSDLHLPSESDLKLDGSDLELDAGASDVLSDNVDSSDVLDALEESGLSGKFENLEELEIDLEANASKMVSSGEILPSEKLEANTTVGGELTEPESPSATTDDKSPSGKFSAPSSTGMSSIVLAADEEDEMVLGENSGSDITLGTEESGISLVDASDTGLSLENVSLELGGSTVESLELGEDKDSDVEELVTTEPGIENDFPPTSGDKGSLIGPGESGSQAITLDDAELATASSVTFSSTEAAASGILEEELTPNSVAVLGPATPLRAATGAQATPATMSESSYSRANIAFLFLCLLLLTLCGMMMFDLLRNIWSWDKIVELNSTIMDTILKALRF